ncbi:MULTISPECIES: hypothetical protein [unclassified Bartonella]|uniref:hypothetical protein n=1 Tax=unclassified Bartonella TaxID=2645622 RepID=UPI0023603F85|nr:MULTISPECIES: hypothetical protein [unclassified Bartonella]
MKNVLIKIFTAFVEKEKFIGKLIGREMKNIINFYAVKIRSVELVEKVLLILIEIGIKGVVYERQLLFKME